MSARERLARAQEELARALGTGAPVPAGFDAGRVRAAAEALLSKRRRLVQRAWPGLARALGEDFSPRFDTWARDNPLVGVEPLPLADGRRFAESLRASGALPPEGEAEVLGFELRWRLTPEGGLAPYRGPVLRVVRTGPERRWTLLARLPGGRLRWWRLPG
jgi:molybdopterin biosynthesis enzyme